MKDRGRPPFQSRRAMWRDRMRVLRTNPDTEFSPPPYWRPQTRADCVDGPRPCPYVGCRHHLGSEVSRNGSLRIVTDGMDGELERMPQTCALDVAEKGEQTLEEVAIILRVTRERVRQIQQRAHARLLAHMLMDEGFQ